MQDYPYIFNNDVSNMSLKNNRLMDFEDNNILAKYHNSNLLNRLLPMFKWKGLPDTIPERVINIQMLVYGYTIIFKHNGELYSSFGNLGGKLDYNYMPTLAIVANPFLNLSKTFKIHEDCVVIPNDMLYMGAQPINSYYSTQLVDNDQSLHCSLIVNRLMNVLVAKDMDSKHSLDDVINDLKKGKISSAIDDDDLMEHIKSVPFSNSSSQTIVQLLEHRQYVKGSWWNEWGVQSNYNMKRETITSSENILNVDSILPFSDNMLECRLTGAAEVKKIFGVDIIPEFNSSWAKIRNEIKVKEKINEQESNMKNKSNQLDLNLETKSDKDGENNENK